MVCGFFIAQWMSVSISGGMVAENSNVWRWRGHSPDAPHVRQKTHVQHPVGFVQHQVLDVVEPAIAPLNVVKQPARRGDEHIHSLDRSASICRP